MQDCYFCQTIAGYTKMGLVEGLQSDLFIFAWDHAPATPGHALIIPKRHVQYMKDLNADERASLIDCAIDLKNHISSTDLNKTYSNLLNKAEDEISTKFINNALKKLHGIDRTPDAYNDGLNDGPAAGQTVPHFHWHVMPRWNGDIADAVGGVRNTIPGMGNYKK